MRTDVVRDLLDHDLVAQELLAAAIPARLAYIGLDGGPRVIPIGFVYRSPTFELFTIPDSAKVAALRANPSVALTIDTETQPPHVLMVRGVATVEQVDGVPEDYIESGRRLMPAAVFDGWAQEVRALYDSMVRISITPTWAKVLDFETRAPAAVVRSAEREGAVPR